MTTSSISGNNGFRFLKKLGVFLFWGVLWEVAACAAAQEVLLPAPHAVLARLASLAMTPAFWESAALSLLRIFLGFLLSFFCAVLAGFLTYRFALARELLSPLITAVKATPVASFIILALVWLSRENVPTFTSFLMVFPIVWSSVDTGLRQSDQDLFEVTQIFGFSRLRRLRLFYLPTLSPYLAASAKTSLGMAWKAGIAAEVLCMPTLSIGKELYESKIYLESTDLFAWTLTVILLSLLLEWTLGLLFAHFTQRRHGHGDA